LGSRLTLGGFTGWLSRARGGFAAPPGFHSCQGSPGRFESRRGQQNQGFGRTKGGLNCKVTVLVDAKGRALQLAIAPGQRNDMIAAEEIVFPKDTRVVADKGYDGDRFRKRIREADSEPCIPPRAGRRQPARYHRGYYKRRHRVENFFQRIKRLRRVGLD
jgi:transposase